MLISILCNLTVWNLGVLLDNSLKFDKQICAVVRSCFYHLRLLVKVQPFLSGKNLETVMHAFVTSRLDYCNSLYIGASQTCVTLTVSSKCCGLAPQREA